MFGFFKNKNNKPDSSDTPNDQQKTSSPSPDPHLIFDGTEISGCTSGFTDLVIPDGVTNIWSSGLSSTRSTLRSVVIPEGISTIRANTFQDCPDLVSVKLPESLRSIRTKAFANCVNLREINLHDDIKSIADDAFMNCPKLALPENRLKNASGTGMAASFRSLPDNTEYAGAMLVKGGFDTPTDLVVPDGVKAIGNGAFTFFGIKSLVLPEGLEVIYDNAFSLCDDLESVQLPDTLKYICSGAFSCCGSLKTINVPDNLQYVAKDAFSKCSDLSAPLKMKFLRKSASYKQPPDPSVFTTLPNESAPVPQDAVQNSPTAPNEPVVNEKVLMSCGISDNKRIVVPDGVEAINHRAFLGSDVEEVILPDTVTVIGKMAFADCRSLKSIKLSERLVRIADRAFLGCVSLERIDFPQTLEFVPGNAFENCQKLALTDEMKRFMLGLGELDELVAIFHSSNASCRLVGNDVVFYQAAPDTGLYIDLGEYLMCIRQAGQPPKYKSCSSFEEVKKTLFEMPLDLYV